MLPETVRDGQDVAGSIARDRQPIARLAALSIALDALGESVTHACRALAGGRI